MRTSQCADCGAPFPYGEWHVCSRPIKPVELRAVANEPDPDVVAAIESLLIRAKSGEVRAVGLSNVNTDGSVGTAWAGDRWATLLGCTFELLCRLREEGKPAER
jgi:hypothetical protein